MEAGGAALPELESLGLDSEASPEGRQRDFTVAEFFADFSEFLHEKLSRGDDFALVGNPGADLRITGAGGEILEGLGGADFLRSALNDNLTLEGDPWKEQADAGVGGDLLRLAAAVVGEEYEALGIEVFQEDGPLTGHARLIDSRECHGVGFVEAELGGLGEPS